MNDKKLPEIDRPCPKCGNTRAYGPEYRRGVGNDADLGEHLRHYCTVCRFMWLDPTKDRDTPERRKEIREAYERRRQSPPPYDKQRDQDIDTMRRIETRAPYGWRK
jgi:CRISPR/Cas system-associated protein Cas10 (large subunit of type III CRISPR-Cas system)